MPLCYYLLMTQTGIATFREGSQQLALPIVTKQDLAQYALWAIEHAVDHPADGVAVLDKLRRLYPVLLHPDVVMLAVKLEETGNKLFKQLAQELRSSIELG